MPASRAAGESKNNSAVRLVSAIRCLVLAFQRLSVIHLGADAAFLPAIVEDIQFRQRLP